MKKRATSDHQKRERRQAILAAAADRFQASSYELISMQEVADRAKVAKGTLYLYFKTKEELFLTLYTQALEQWFDEIDDKLRQIAAAQATCTAAEFAALVGGTLPTHPMLPRLMAITHSILEHNIDAATAITFKRMLLARMLQTGQWAETCLPFLRPGQGAHSLMQLYALVIGFQSIAEPAPVVRPLLDQPELKILQIQFAEELIFALAALLQGIELQSRGEKDG